MYGAYLLFTLLYDQSRVPRTVRDRSFCPSAVLPGLTILHCCTNTFEVDRGLDAHSAKRHSYYSDSHLSY